MLCTAASTAHSKIPRKLLIRMSGNWLPGQENYSNQNIQNNELGKLVVEHLQSAHALGYISGLKRKIKEKSSKKKSADQLPLHWPCKGNWRPLL